MAPSTAICQHQKAGIGFAAPLNLTHVEGFTKPEADHVIPRQNFLGDCEMVADKLEPLRAAQSIYQKFRQRLLQKLVVRRRISPR